MNMTYLSHEEKEMYIGRYSHPMEQLGVGFQPQKGEGKKRDETKKCEDGTLTIIKLVILVCLVLFSKYLERIPSL